jgi:hypothetical protein
MVNFQRLVTELTETHSLTEQQIADTCNVGQTTISRLKLTPGAEPRYSTGEALTELLKKHRRRAGRK